MTPPPAILLIDDDEAIRRLCKRMLQRMGYTLLEADCGEAGRDQFNAHSSEISFILLDLNLPDISGETLAEEFRRTHPDLPVVYFSGSVQPAVEGSRNGTSPRFLKKPFTKASLESLMADLGVSSTPSQE